MNHFIVIARSEATKQSILANSNGLLRFARNNGLSYQPGFLMQTGLL
jgi:hypothetical protein